MSIYSPFARALRVVYRAIHPRWRTDPPGAPDGAAVYVVHHQNMFGPVHAVGLLPGEAHIWALHCFCEKQACYEQFAGYTFTARYGWPGWFANAWARVLSWIVPSIVRGVAAIPVYHEASSLVTMRRSLEVLERGEPVIICPDVAYASTDPVMGEVQSGFVLLGQLYARHAGRPLPFVPLYVSGRHRRLVFGDSLTILPGESMDAAAVRMRDAVNALGRRLGDIRDSDRAEDAGAPGRVSDREPS